MRKSIKINLAEAGRQALSAIVTDRNSPQKHVWRAQIVPSANALAQAASSRSAL